MNTKRTGRPPHMGNAELALAMELRTEGVAWKLIAWGLGVTCDTAIKSVALAKKTGMRP